MHEIRTTVEREKDLRLALKKGRLTRSGAVMAPPPLGPESGGGARLPNLRQAL